MAVFTRVSVVNTTHELPSAHTVSQVTSDPAEVSDLPQLRPLVTVDVVIFALGANQRAANPLPVDLMTLLARRELPPYAGHWAIPGRFVRPDESLEQAARRQLENVAEAHDAIYLEQLYTFGDVARDPRGRVISVVYFALAQSEQITPRAGAEWHTMYGLPARLAFDHHAILDYALKRLRYKLEYTAAAFELMPPEFTLRELQEAYMVILDDYTLDKANFRKKLRYRGDEGRPIVEQTGKFRQTRGRPAELYRFAEDAKIEVKTRRLFP
jgi:8-oxo-dGTP diphosphatase